MFKKVVLPAITAFSIILVSCGGGGSETAESGEGVDSTAVAETESSDENEGTFIMALPSPLQIASIFRRSGLEFIPGVTNDPENISKYNTKNSQKLNFGVYSADLAYSALNDQNQDCINYVKNIGELSERLWLTNIFSSISVLKRFEDNMGNSDSLGYIIADFQMDLDSYLEENGLSQNSILIFTGAWVESMYIALKSIQQAPNSKLASRLIEQQKIIQKLVGVVETDGTDYMNDIHSMLNSVSGHFGKFEGLEEVDDEETLEKFAFTDSEQAQLLNDVEALRNRIING